MFDVALDALLKIFSWPYFGYLLLGTMIGNIVGFIPGIGGYFALSLLIPLVIRMDPLAAITILLSAHSLISTGGAVCAVLFGVPGSGQNVSTVFDGYPMTQKGQGAEAVGASLVASAVGGVIGAAVMFISIPVIRPIVMAFGSGEFFLMVMVGVACVVTMATESPVKAVVMAGLGFLLSYVGQDPITGSVRYTFGSLYLADGVSLVALSLGQVALAMMVVMAVQGRTTATPMVQKGMLNQKKVWQGGLEVFRHWWLTIWSSLIGVVVGIIPGLGGEAACLISYAQAKQASKHSEEFGKGCIEGVIAPEAANNSKEGGTLIPTVSFGIPGSGAMAIMLGVLIMMGIVPGPKMLNEHLMITFSMVWTMVVANIIGAVMMMFGSTLLLKALALPTSSLVSMISALIFVGSFSSTYQVGDMITTFCLGVLGYYAWRKHDYPIGPFLLGFVLGTPTERHFSITMATRGPSFITRPISLILAVGFICLVIYPIWVELRKRKRKASSQVEDREDKKRVGLEGVIVTTVMLLLFALFGLDTFIEIEDPAARVFPLIVWVPAVAFGIYQFIKDIKEYRAEAAVATDVRQQGDELHVTRRRELGMFAWFAGLILFVWLVGFLVAAPIFAFLLSMIYFKTKWRTALLSAVVCWIGVFFFYRVAHMSALSRGVLFNLQI